MVFIKNDIIAKCLTELEPKYLECIYAELKNFVLVMTWFVGLLRINCLRKI